MDRRRTRPLIALVGCAAAGCSCSWPTAPTIPPVARPDEAGGFVAIFDGRTLDGWTARGGQATFRVEHGEIVGTTTPNSPNTFLCTDRAYADFELRLEFKANPELNSGVQVRSAFDPSRGVVRGPQVEIDPSARAWTGGIYDEQRRGWLAPLKDRPDAQAAFRQGEWNSMRVLAEGPRLRTWINGVACADLTDQTDSSGFIGLQVHGVGPRSDPLEVRFRHVRVRVLSPAAAP